MCRRRIHMPTLVTFFDADNAGLALARGRQNVIKWRV
jgi:hypothetical protein